MAPTSITSRKASIRPPPSWCMVATPPRAGHAPDAANGCRDPPDRRRSRAIPSQPNALFWNPLGATLDEALKQSGVADGIIAIIGGPEVFSQFLPLYDAFHLSRAAKRHNPRRSRRSSPRSAPHATPEDVLARHGLKPGPRRDLDAAAGVSVVTWDVKARKRQSRERR